MWPLISHTFYNFDFCFILQACAPRYVFFSVSQLKKDLGDSSRQSIVGNRRDPVGTCWVTNFTTSTEFSPCRTREFFYSLFFFFFLDRKVEKILLLLLKHLKLLNNNNNYHYYYDNFKKGKIR